MSDPVTPDWNAAPPWARYWTQDRNGQRWWQHEPMALTGFGYVSRRMFDGSYNTWLQINDTPGPRRMAQRPTEPRPEGTRRRPEEDTP